MILFLSLDYIQLMKIELKNNDSFQFNFHSNNEHGINNIRKKTM